MIGFVGKEVLAAGLGRNIAFAHVGPAVGRQALGVAGGRQRAIEIDVGDGRDQVAQAVHADGEPIDLLEAARAVRKEALPRLLRWRAGAGALLLPGAAVGLARHIGQGIEAILRTKLDLVDRLVGRAGAFLVEPALGIEVAVRRAVELDGVGFQRVCREALHVDRHRLGQALAPQHVEALLAPVGVGAGRQPVFLARLVGGDQGRRVLDRGGGAGEMGDAGLAGGRHVLFLLG